MAETRTSGPRPAIRPFGVSFPDEDLAELCRRIDATRWPERETVDDDPLGVPLATMQELARYWARDHNLPQVAPQAFTEAVVEVDGY